MDKMRKGVVLFITLSVIAAMLALVGVIFSYLEKSKGDASYTAALIQADLLFRDTNDAIKVLLGKAGKDEEMRKTVLSTLYLAPMTLQPKEGDMFTTIDCQPLDNGVNINWLGYENNDSAQVRFSTVQSIFDDLVEQYALQDAALLLGMIQAEIDTEKSVAAENQSRLEQKKGMITRSLFRKIVRDYQFRADDPAVEQIAWEKFFSFDRKEIPMDGNYLSAELIAILFGMELATVKEEWFEGDDLQDFVAENGGDLSRYNKELFSEKPTERMQCRISYGYQSNTYAFGFDYLEGKAEKFEFYGKQ
ncbi:MAG: hypothetical protein U9Q90_00085 [Campylobacterota bacterium]|nr:hypothetical protein [Campylobacterota bacterium]